MVLMHRRRGGVTGIYHCDIPGHNEDTHKLYVGVYTRNTGGYFQDHHSNLLECFSQSAKVNNSLNTKFVHVTRSWYLVLL